MLNFQKREQQRLYKQQYRVKKKAINRIERERAVGLATLSSVPAVAVQENLLAQQVYDGFEMPMTGEGRATQEVFELDEDYLPEGYFELEDPIEDGELADGFLSLGVNAGSGDFDTEDHTDKESNSESDEEESLCQFLVKWNSRHNITREAMKDLLRGLKVHSHPGLPLDPRTLLQTNLSPCMML